MTRRTHTTDRRDRDFRPDIEGLRAIAVLSVMIYHVAPPLLPGGFVGVDIFFVISGFLITSHLANEHLRTGRISLPRFYARRALRLIPAATVTLVGTAVAVVLFVPRAFWAQFGGDLVASAFYAVNWTLAAQSVDYLAEDNAVSPAQHFWSLAVEEQYYLIWPLLMLAAAFLAGLVKQSKRRGFAAMGILVTVASAGWAMLEFAQQNPAAYFVTTTRLWELAVGSVVAIIYPRLLRSTSGKAAATFVGLAAIVASMWLIRETLQWPSPWAFLPIAGAALLLGAGGGTSTTWAERVLGFAPLVWVGGLSYSLYLWHWPVVVVAEQVLGKTGVLQGVAVLVTSFVLAWLTRVTLENPIRFHPRLRARARSGIAVGVVGALLSAAAGGALIVAGSAATGERAVRAAGAAVLRTPISETPPEDLKWIGQPMTPLPAEANEDLPTHYEDDCFPPFYRAEVRICTYGDLDADRTIAMIGDSKIMQWQPAIERIAEQRHYKIILLMKNSCPFADAPALWTDGTRYVACEEWRGPAFAVLKKYQPDVVFTGQIATGAFPANASSRQRLIDGLASMYSRLRSAGFTTVIMGDNPFRGGPIPACLIANESDRSVCTFARDYRISGFPSQSAAVAELGGTRVNADGKVTPGKDTDLVLVDMADAICPPQLKTCPPVIGNVLIYRQGSHITATYVGTMTKRLAHALDEAEVFD